MGADEKEARITTGGGSPNLIGGWVGGWLCVSYLLVDGSRAAAKVE